MTLPLPGQPGHGRTAVLRRRPVRIVDGRPEGGYTSRYELICPSCGDNPYLDFLDVPARLQWLRGPWTLGAGLAAYDEHIGPDPSANGHKAGSLAPASEGRRHARIGSRNRQQPAVAVGERTKKRDPPGRAGISRDRTSVPARCGRPVAGCFLEEDLDPATFRELRPTQSRRSAEGQPRGYEHRRHDAVSGKLGENVRSAADLAPSGTAGVSPSRCTEQDVLPRR